METTFEYRVLSQSPATPRHQRKPMSDKMMLRFSNDGIDVPLHLKHAVNANAVFPEDGDHTFHVVEVSSDFDVADIPFVDDSVTKILVLKHMNAIIVFGGTSFYSDINRTANLVYDAPTCFD